MKSIAVYENLPTDHADCFEEIEVDTPVPGERDILVRVDAIAINPVDSKERHNISGRLDEPLVLGWDACGEVISVGGGVENFKPGNMVMYAGDITRPGCYTEFQLVDERIVGPKPASLSCEEAATLPLTTLVAWESPFDRLEIDRDDSGSPALLIIGAAGGLGSMAIQFARQLSNCTIIATGSRPESRDWCSGLGAHHVIDHSGDLGEQLKAIGFETVPYILNCSNNIPYWEIMSKLVSPEGAICLVASTKAKLDLDLYMAKSVRINYELMFTRSIFGTEKMSLQGEVLSRISEMIAAGTIRHVMTENLRNMTTSSLAKAHALIETGHMIGKMALSGILSGGNSNGV
ncbi:MAG: zinc-binding alcohol dehydrogenase family protein [Proteobacteria bacterium]|nr:zinc-binding alcohol dehydrogenase family protein [Pseudomonadota bacterium]